MTPAAQVSKVNTGNDMFVDKVTPYLQDLKFQPEKKIEELIDLGKND
jgi:hypothetical protein